VKHPLAIIIATLTPQSASANVSEITNKATWQTAAGPSAAITFAEYPSGTQITNQYASSGVLFTDNVFVSVTATYPSDSHGVYSDDGFGNLGTIHLSFTAPRLAFGTDFLGSIIVTLYSGGQLIFTSHEFVAGFTPFIGFVSTIPFDAAVVTQPDTDEVNIDNIYFGPPIPAPGVLSVLFLGLVHCKRRRNE
jgi:hypothetical protein